MAEASANTNADRSILPDSASVLRDVYEKTGWRLFMLGILLLALMAAALCAAYRDPWAVSALIASVAAIVRGVPAIVVARYKIFERECQSTAGQPSKEEAGNSGAAVPINIR